MAALKDTKALIIDIRRNGGGSPDAVAYLVSFFLDGSKPPMLINDFVEPHAGHERVHNAPVLQREDADLLSRQAGLRADQPRALSPAAKSSPTTCRRSSSARWSARPPAAAPIPAASCRSVRSSAIFMPDGRPVNPVTKTNWEGVGVIPDIATPVEDALKVALERLGQKPAAKDIDALSQAKLFQPRTTPYPGGEAALRRIVGELARGEPNYDLMSPGLADATRRQLTSLKDTFASLGELKTVRFMEVGPQGLDVYDCTFANGSVTWRIAFSPDGKVATSGFSRNAMPTPD